MRLRFSKMHGLGNDFVVFDAINQSVELTPQQCRLLADRHFGVGCDQILLVESPRLPDTDFHYRIFNADGSEAGQCGNGARCFVRFVREHGLSDRSEIRVGTDSGIMHLYQLEDGQVRVNMGPPILEPARVPFNSARQAPRYPLEVDGRVLEIGVVSMGNPHAVLRVDQHRDQVVQTIGQRLQNHPAFPERVNVGFMRILNPGEIDLRVYERGTGETQACGSGACAAVVSGRLQQLLDPRVLVHLPGGDLVIEWQGEAEPVWMSGPATTVFEGEITL